MTTRQVRRPRSLDGVGTTARGWAALLLLAAVFLGHGLQCGSPSDGAAHAGPDRDIPTMSVTIAAAGVHLTATAAGHGADSAASAPPTTHSGTSPATTAGSAPGHWHGLPGHLWAVCLAVLAAGLAVLLVLTGPRLLRQRTPPAASPSWLRGLSWPAPTRPPDPFCLCVLRT